MTSSKNYGPSAHPPESDEKCTFEPSSGYVGLENILNPSLAMHEDFAGYQDLSEQAKSRKRRLPNEGENTKDEEERMALKPLEQFNC